MATSNTRTVVTLAVVGVLFVWFVISQGNKEEPAPAPPAAQAAPSVDMAALNRHLAATSKHPDRIVSFVKGDGRAYRLYLDYTTPPRSMAQVERDSVQAMQSALEAIKASGVDPWSGGVFVSLYAQKQEGDMAGRSMIRRYGNTTFSSHTGTIEFKAQR